MLGSMAQPATETNRDDALLSALEAFDRARGWEAYRDAQERVCSLGAEVAPSVIAELSKVQSPERSDLLLTLLGKWVRLDEVLDLATRAESGWVLRSALAEALRYYAEDLHPSEARQRRRIAETLAALTRDGDAGVRIAAVEAIGLARLFEDPAAAAALQAAATSDPVASIREEAQRILAETR
jgi:hypothetical protein